MSLLGVKRTHRFAAQMSAFDPKRTLQPDGHALPPAINLLLKSPQNGQSLWLKAGMNGG
jgi:hypothetical protein